LKTESDRMRVDIEDLKKKGEHALKEVGTLKVSLILITYSYRTSPLSWKTNLSIPTNKYPRPTQALKTLR
jgi:hypothetical protein